MARVTVEDCIEKTEGVFSLIKLASQRARRIANGAQTLLENEENDKPTVLALREIAEGLVRAPRRWILLGATLRPQDDQIGLPTH